MKPKDVERLPGTGEVARRLTKELGRTVSEGAIQQVLRRRPEINPPLVNRRRRWRAEDVKALLDYMRSRSTVEEAKRG